MKLSKNILLLLSIVIITSCKNEKSSTKVAVANDNIATKKSIEIKPITHGTLVLETENEVIYIDPTGGLKAFAGYKNPTLVLITDIHGDHLNIETLEALNIDAATLIAPAAVIEKLPKNISKTIVTLNNGDSYNTNNAKIEAIPMYNLREEALKYHPKGRGNGYVITINGERIYISGDTEDIPEMRSLKNIDKAFVCMNLPWTMTIESAASAVIDFKPKKVYPYHYRSAEGLSDIDKFKRLVNEDNTSTEVILLNWYYSQ
ncbi:Zn-dependent hydrolases of the beta-lactamase fold-like protein [Flavobacteriales bacterium ALC-1]|nr:Zn-dependent hydrolases of the beta-lactamase fold-like protein [Flavobacteriales bacterium ALC-1]